jgi:hypothetical protein
MPRKQRFKPSRKPKPTPEVQTQEHDRSNTQRTDATRTPETDRLEHAVEPADDPRPEEAEAR